MNDPTVSVIILNYKNARMTVRCVQALQEQTVKDEMEIIVVDNHSENDSIGTLRNRLRHEPNVRIVETVKNIGYGNGNNYGVQYARGEFILIVNPDTALRPDAIATMLQYLKENPKVGIVGPRLIYPDGVTRDSYRTFPKIMDIVIKRTPLRWIFTERMNAYLQHDRSPEETREVDWIVGACFLISRDLFDRLGGFDPRFFLFFEDTDLCRRCWDLGKSVVYLPTAQADDGEHRLSSGGFLTIFTKKTLRIHLASAVKYFRKWGYQ